MQVFRLRYNRCMDSRRARNLLILGDLLAILAVSIVGYLTHYAGKEAFSLRWLSTFLPFSLGWFLLAPWLGLFRAETADDPARVWWRAALAAWLIAPFAAWLRGLWLNAAIVPVFVTVLGPSAALGLALWRWVWASLARQKAAHG